MPLVLLLLAHSQNAVEDMASFWVYIKGCGGTYNPSQERASFVASRVAVSCLWHRTYC